MPDDFGQYGNSSPDESVNSQGCGALSDQYNGGSDGSHELYRKQKKHREGNTQPSRKTGSGSDNEDAEDCDNIITEEDYRTMLSKHLQESKKSKLKSFTVCSDSRRARLSGKHKNGTKGKRCVSDTMEESFIKDNGKRHKLVSPSGRISSLDSSYIEIGNGITYVVPPGYDKLAVSLKLPSLCDIKVEESVLKGMLDKQSLAAIVAIDKRLEVSNHRGLAEPQSQYESLQARLKAQRFSLQVTEDPFAIPEGSAGRIRRSIMSESGNLQIYYVKVLEKGDSYEIIERSLPKKHIVKKDPAVIEREEMEKIAKVWTNIVKRDIPRQQRNFNSFHRRQVGDAKRICESCQREVKSKVSRSLKMMKGAALRTKKLSRDMVMFWKRVDKEQAEIRKKEEREAAEALKREEELREAKRQQQRLNFLLSQTELYSHFMQNKSTDADCARQEEGLRPADAKPDEEEDSDEADLRREALKAAQQAVSKQKKITDAFDNDYMKLRQAVDLSTSANEFPEPNNMDLLNPSTMPEKSSVQTPELFKGRLKEYQLKGLQWLVNCYEQGLNGILADEMGLGKTIQAMAFLAHLAEEKNIWGPFLVVAPSSVLNNWADEVGRFCPDLKILPYWGGLPERTVLRKNINPKRLYRRDSGFHILITSYQLLVSDEKYLRRVKWQYMVLDEAQAIKSSNSIRWRTLLSFNCRNRLLLTGTPIQNNMAELWALLHFIMPTLFDSHEQFNEWFSKGIESHAEHGGTLNEHQLNRLHAVLKPFMLRRVKKDVMSEMTGKTEVTVHCKLSSRQQAFYQAIKNKISLNELFDGSRGHLNEKKMINLMNIVMQLRKVCNHPELFERNEGSSYFYFADISNSLLPPPFGELEDIYYAGERNPIKYNIPKLVYQRLLCDQGVPSVSGCCLSCGSFERIFNVFSTSNINQSLVEDTCKTGYSVTLSGSFGFTRLINLSPAEVSFLANCSSFERLLFSGRQYDMLCEEMLDMVLEANGDDLYDDNDTRKIRAVSRMLLLPTKSQHKFLRLKLAIGPDDEPYQAVVVPQQERLTSNIRLLRAAYAFIPCARAPPINYCCSDRGFAYQLVEELYNPWIKKLLLGFGRTSEFNGPREPTRPHHLIQEMDTNLPISKPLLQLPFRIFGSSPPMSNFDPAKMLTDSGKLQTLDILLRRLRAENHRVLLFAQMTKMLDILEDYMNFRKYKYFRLDGSSTIVDRRDMVRDFQRRNDVFVFLLSTRAGGLGINLTAADTVIFYEIDWNPTLDMQAMDRAHRLGQTKEVTVYRLICKDTVEEKILQRANQKNTVQQLVMTGKHVQGDLLKQEDVVSLLIDDAQVEQKLKEISLQAKDRQKRKHKKGIRVDSEGDVTLEDFNNNPTPEGTGEQENANSKKRKSSSTKKVSKPRDADVSKTEDLSTDADDQNTSPLGSEDHLIQQKPKRLKRHLKSIKEDVEPEQVSASKQQDSYVADSQPPSDDLNHEDHEEAE